MAAEVLFPGLECPAGWLAAQPLPASGKNDRIVKNGKNHLCKDKVFRAAQGLKTLMDQSFSAIAKYFQQLLDTFT
jgi:hypothetical protein